MRISDLSSDVFSSDLPYPALRRAHALRLLDGADAALRPRPQSVGRVPPGAVRADGPEFRHGRDPGWRGGDAARSEEHTSELQSLMRTSYAVFCLKKKNKQVLNPLITSSRIHQLT